MVRIQGKGPDADQTLPSVTRAAMPLLVVVLGVLLGSRPLSAAPIPVRFAEGSVHGFIVLRTQDGQFLAQGDLLELVRGADIQKTTVFRFTDGSLFRETVVFTQQGVYTLQSYRLEQHGPAFTEDTTLFLEAATGRYRVETRPHTGGPEKVLEGKLDLPPDVYNGMIPTIVKDIPKGASETVHFVAFMPGPKIIQLQITPSGEQTLRVGEDTMTAVRYVLKAKLGTWLKIFAILLGRTPKDARAWVIDGDVPAFVGFEGQLYPADPVWRIELLSPTLP